jgi:hypothetical protein
MRGRAGVVAEARGRLTEMASDDVQERVRSIGLVRSKL